MKTKLLILLLTISTSIFSQIQIKKSEIKTFKFGEASRSIYPVGDFSITGFISNNDTIYTFTYRNSEYNSIVSMESVIIGNKTSLTDFYSILKSTFKDENKSNKDYLVTFNLGKDNVRLSYSDIGKGSCLIYVENKGYCQLTEKTLDKLFNK